MPSKPEIYVGTHIPCYKDGAYNINQTIMNHQPSLLPEILREAGVPQSHLIEIFEKMGGHKLSDYQFICDE